MKQVSEQEAKELAVEYVSDPNVSSLAKKHNRRWETVVSALKTQGINPSRSRIIPEKLKSVDDVVSDSIIRRMEKNPEMFSKNFEQLSAVLGSANVVGVLRSPEKYKETVVDQARTALLLSLSALITQDKLSLASPSAIAAIVPVLAELASGKYQLGAGKQDKFSSEEIILSLKACLRRVKTFDPVMAKETEVVIDSIMDINSAAFAEGKK